MVFPPRCAGCARGAWPFCRRVSTALVPLLPPWCERCGRPRPDPVESCRECPPPPLAGARAPFLYAGPARAAIIRLKFSGWRSVAAALADAMVAIGPPSADAVTWVPLARRRLAERGYDQARALAVAVGARLDLPVVQLAQRVLATAPQARRTGEERRAAMKGAFQPTRLSAPTSVSVDRRRAHDRRHRGCVCRGRGRRGRSRRSLCWPPRVRSPVSRGVAILGWALNRVCGCPGIFPGSRRQPRAKRPT